jgi:hypothetical protein
MVSNEQVLQLPFQKTDLRKSLSCSLGDMNLEFDLVRYVGHLLQKANRSLKEKNAIIGSVEAKLRSIESVPDLELIQGKDGLSLLEKILVANGVGQGDAVRILSASFERSYVAEYPNLRKVVEFLSAGSA